MTDIRIRQQHRLSPTNARAAAQKIADKMAQDYDMQSEWNGDVLLFSRSGVSGRLTICETEAQLEITLGFLFKAFSGRIEEEVGKKMRKVFGTA